VLYAASQPPLAWHAALWEANVSAVLFQKKQVELEAGDRAG
jgi:hypothetical protein